MALEKSWQAVTQAFTANGTTLGVVTVADATGFFNKQLVMLTSNTQPNLSLEVKVVTPTTITVGPIGKGINTKTDISAYLASDSAAISAPAQPIPSGPTPDEIIKAVYQRDPSVAIRTVMVDSFGNIYNDSNPLPITIAEGTIPDNWTEIDLGYDTNNNLTSVIYTIPSKPQVTLTLSYDSNGNLTKVVN